MHIDIYLMTSLAVQQLLQCQDVLMHMVRYMDTNSIRSLYLVNRLWCETIRYTGLGIELDNHASYYGGFHRLTQENCNIHSLFIRANQSVPATLPPSMRHISIVSPYQLFTSTVSSSMAFLVSFEFHVQTIDICLTHFPRSLQTLTLRGDTWDNPSGVYPPNLKHLTLDIKQRIRVHARHFPQSLETLHMCSTYFERDVIPFLPPNVKELVIVSEFFNEPVNTLPPHLETLMIKSSSFRHPLNNMPETMRTIVLICSRWNHPLDDLPSQLTTLVLDCDMLTMETIVLYPLPHNLIEFSLQSKQYDSTQADEIQLPLSLERLYVPYIHDMIPLPPKVQTFTMSSQMLPTIQEHDILEVSHIIWETMVEKSMQPFTHMKGTKTYETMKERVRTLPFRMVDTGMQTSHVSIPPDARKEAISMLTKKHKKERSTYWSTQYGRPSMNIDFKDFYARSFATKQRLIKDLKYIDMITQIQYQRY